MLLLLLLLDQHAAGPCPLHPLLHGLPSLTLGPRQMLVLLLLLLLQQQLLVLLQQQLLVLPKRFVSRAACNAAAA